MAHEYIPPPITTPEVAKVSVGFTTAGHLAVKVHVTKGILQLPNLEEMFGRAAAAFMREFSVGNPLLEASKIKGYSPALEQITDELAADHNVPIIDNRTDVS